MSLERIIRDLVDKYLVEKNYWCKATDMIVEFLVEKHGSNVTETGIHLFIEEVNAEVNYAYAEADLLEARANLLRMEADVAKAKADVMKAKVNAKNKTNPRRSPRIAIMSK